MNFHCGFPDYRKALKAAFGHGNVSRATVSILRGRKWPNVRRWRENPTELSPERFQEFVSPHHRKAIFNRGMVHNVADGAMTAHDFRMTNTRVFNQHRYKITELTR